MLAIVLLYVVDLEVHFLNSILIVKCNWWEFHSYQIVPSDFYLADVWPFEPAWFRLSHALRTLKPCNQTHADDQHTSTHNMTWANTITWCKITTRWYLMSWCYPITWERGSPGHYRAVVHSQWMVFYDVKVNMDNQLMGGSPANTTVLSTNSTKSCFFIGFLITLLLNLQFRSNTECNEFYCSLRNFKQGGVLKLGISLEVLHNSCCQQLNFKSCS